MSKQPTACEDWKHTVERQPPPRAAVRRKPHTAEEAAVLARLVTARGELYLKARKIEAVGPRQWRYHLGQQKLLEYHERQRQP